VDELVAGYLPLVYNIVGRALAGHSDVDDVVQETMPRSSRAHGPRPRQPDTGRIQQSIRIERNPKGSTSLRASRIPLRHMAKVG
jgi:hypothetical protein